MQPKLRFRQFNKDWHSYRLNAIALVKAGGDVDKHKLSSTGKYPVLSNGLTNDGIKGYYPDYRVKAPAITVTGRGKLGIAKARMISFTPVVRLIFIKSSKLDVVFGANAINQMHIFKEYTGVPQLTAKQFKRYFINIPSLSEQHLIGCFFINLDKLINLQQSNLILLKKQKQGCLQKFFRNINGKNLHFYRLDNLCDIKTGDKNVQDNVPNGKYPFFDRSTELKHLNTYDYDEETIIYAGEGEKFLPRYFNGKYSLHQRAYSLYNFKKNLIDVGYLYEFLLTQSNNFVRYAVGTTVKSLRKECFKHIKVPKIPLDRQIKIGQFLNINDKLSNLYQQKLYYLHKLKKAYLQKMFC